MKVFISHSSTDKKFVRLLKNCLNENCIQTWLDEDQLDLGDSLRSKLDEAIDESSHFVIVLSPASISSNWVLYELEKAIKNSSTGLVNKIIPVKYRECEIPEYLGELLYGDLSNEVVLPNGNEVRFLSSGFDKFFLQLVRALKNSSNSLSKEEKLRIIKTMGEDDDEIDDNVVDIFRGNYRIIGFKTGQTKSIFKKRVADELNNRRQIVGEPRPVLLPKNLVNIIKVRTGDLLQIESALGLKSKGHFAGFRSDDLSIVVGNRIRRELNLENLSVYETEIDPNNNKIKLLNKI